MGKPAEHATRSLILAVVCLLFACSIERHHRTLSFFFDGVPDPTQPTPDDARIARSIPRGSLSAEEKAALLARRVQTATVYFHKPVEERQCDRCHIFEDRDSAGAQSGWRGGVPKLIAPPDQLCAKCHEPPEGKYVHGPAGAVRCYICHVPHQSRFPHLQRYENPQDVCRSCHSGETLVSEDRHREFVENCVVCHDPHSSELEFLLKADWEEASHAAEAAEAAETAMDDEANARDGTPESRGD